MSADALTPAPPRQDVESKMRAQVERICELEAELQLQAAKAQAALRELNHFRYALDQQASVAVTDLDGVIVYANQHFAELSGYAREELLGRTHSIVKSGVHPASVYAEMWATILKGSVWRGEVCNKRKNGELYWVDAAIVPYKDETGQITQFVSIRTEITQRKLAQELLVAQETKTREINERLRQIADSLPAMISYWDSTQICRFANRRHFARFGLNPHQIVGLSFAELFGTAFDQNKRERVSAVLRGERQMFDQGSKSSDGSLRHWQSDYLPHWHEGEVIGFYALVLDITERKQAEERSARQEAMLAATSRMAEVGGWELERGAARPVWSDMVYRIHDLDVGPVPPVEKALDFYPPEARSMVLASLKVAFEEGKGFDFVAPLVTASGRHRWVRSIGAPQLEGGQVTRIIGAFQDVTHQRQLETELAQSQKLESIGQLSAGIAHEINTPTQFIGSNFGFLKETVEEIFGLVNEVAALADAGEGDAVSRAALRDALWRVDLEYLRSEVPRAIEQSADGISRIQRIVGAMKEFSHPAVDKTLVDINRAIASTIVVASNEWKYVAEIETRFDEALPSVCVMPGSFNQVILNMIVNAAHAVSSVVEGKTERAGQKGTITVSTQQIGSWAEVRIHDTGCGIPAEIRDRIFDPFFTTKPVGKGTGQGLSIAHDVIVKKHGGAIAVESEPGLGTTFILRIPLDDRNSHASAAA